MYKRVRWIWKKENFKQEQRDAIISVSLMFLLSVAIMAAAAGTLHPLGLKVENAIDMVKLLEPLAGRLAISVFVAGLTFAHSTRYNRVCIHYDLFKSIVRINNNNDFPFA